MKAQFQGKVLVPKHNVKNHERVDHLYVLLASGELALRALACCSSEEHLVRALYQKLYQLIMRLLKFIKKYCPEFAPIVDKMYQSRWCYVHATVDKIHCHPGDLFAIELHIGQILIAFQNITTLLIGSGAVSSDVCDLFRTKANQYAASLIYTFWQQHFECCDCRRASSCSEKEEQIEDLYRRRAYYVKQGAQAHLDGNMISLYKYLKELNDEHHLLPDLPDDWEPADSD